MEAEEEKSPHFSWRSSPHNFLPCKLQQSLGSQKHLSSNQSRASVDDVIANPSSPKLVLGSYVDCLPKHDHPVNWNNDDVMRWVSWCCREYSLFRPPSLPTDTDHTNAMDTCCSSKSDSDVICSRFNMNGKALCILSKEAFLSRCPEYGDVLFHIFSLFKQKWDEIYSPTLFQVSSLLGLELVYPSSAALLLMQNQLALHQHQQQQQQQPILRQRLTQPAPTTALHPSLPPHSQSSPPPMPVIPATHLDMVLEKAFMTHYHHHQQQLHRQTCEYDKLYITGTGTPEHAVPHIPTNEKRHNSPLTASHHVTLEEIKERTVVSPVVSPSHTVVPPSSMACWGQSATGDSIRGAAHYRNRLPSLSSYHHNNHLHFFQQQHPYLGLDLRRPPRPTPPPLRKQEKSTSGTSLSKLKDEECLRDEDYSHEMGVSAVPPATLSHQDFHKQLYPSSSSWGALHSLPLPMALHPQTHNHTHHAQYSTRDDKAEVEPIMNRDFSSTPTSNGFSYHHMTTSKVEASRHRHLTSPITPSPSPLGSALSVSPCYPMLPPPRNMKTEPKLLWAFLHSLLTDPSGQYSHMIRWVESSCEPASPSSNTFRILEPNDVAKLWGAVKNRSNMTYEKMSRALRYYYKMKIIRKEPGKKLTYRFLQSPSSLRESLKPLGRKPNQQTTSKFKPTGGKNEKYRKNLLLRKEEAEEDERGGEEKIPEGSPSGAEICEKKYFEVFGQPCQEKPPSYVVAENSADVEDRPVRSNYQKFKSVVPTSAIASDENHLQMFSNSRMT